jgi:glycosyltransferase involved in cell wall biosynthesis
MKLSVVIPFYRELDLIGRAVESVIINADTVSDVEILICNDGNISEAEIRSRISKESNLLVRVLRNQGRKGPGGARNTGLDASSGDIIAFLDADDIWMPGKISKQLDAIKMGATFVVTGYRFENRNVLVTPPDSIQHPIDIFLKRGIGTSTVVITRALLGDFRFKDIRFSQDIDFWYTLACSDRFRYAAINEALVVYGNQGSTKNKLVQLWYMYKVLSMNRLPYFLRAKVLLSYINSGVKRHYLSRLLK